MAYSLWRITDNNGEKQKIKIATFLRNYHKPLAISHMLCVASL